MDQAALQRVTLARPSGTLCGTARGAREQQRLVSSKDCAHGSFSPFSDQRLSGWPTRRESGVFSGFPGWPNGIAMLQCTAGTLLRRRHSGSTWTVLQLLSSFAPPWQCMFWWRVYCYGKHVIRHYDEVLTMLDSACDVFPFDVAQ